MSSVSIPDKVYFSIGDVARIANVKTYVLRYWEGQFSVLNPEKSSNQRRLYRRKDIENVLLIKHLLYDLKYSIEGARKHMRGMRQKNAEASTLQRSAQCLDEAKSELRALIQLCQK